MGTPDTTPQAFAEIQGLYGPVTISERLIQRIWLRGDFQKNELLTQAGKPLQILHPGRWNLQEGPDFLGADLLLDGQRCRGDVELHFYEEDWQAHGHTTQRSFSEVILHVVTFPPKNGATASTCFGRRPEMLCLLPYLEEDLEAYASEEAVRAWEGPDSASLLEGFLSLDPLERQRRLIENAQKRFSQKVAYVRRRLKQAPWPKVCHQMTLEVLGYRRNRAPMSAIAQAMPPEVWPGLDIETIFQSQAPHWRLAGLRPANHPRHRLTQYQTLLRTQPDWQARLQAWGKAQRVRSGRFEPDTKLYRKQKRLTAQRRELADSILAGAMGGTRLNTWMVDAALPLLATAEPAAWFPLWFHWFPGDMPAAVDHVLEQSGLPPQPQPRSNGWAQGAWQLFLECGL